MIQHGGDNAVLEYAAGFIDYMPCRHAAALAAFTRAMHYARQAGDRRFETSIRVKAASSIYQGPHPGPRSVALAG